MSPPTIPALSAGEPGGSTKSNVTPPSVELSPSTPKYERLAAGAPIRARRPTFFTNALIKPPPAKKIARIIHIQVMPVKPKRRFRPRYPRPVCRAIGAVMPGPYGAVYCPLAAAVAFGKRTVSVYSAGPSPSRFPHDRQKRISFGIGAPHCAQTIAAL